MKIEITIEEGMTAADTTIKIDDVDVSHVFQYLDLKVNAETNEVIYHMGRGKWF